MILTPDQQQVKALLTETITLLCKNGLHFQSEFSIEGLIGITLDQEDVFLISIKETIKCDNSSCVGVKANSHSKAEQLKRTSPTSVRSKRHDRANESNCSGALIKFSLDHTNISSVSLDDSAPSMTDPPDVKMEFSSPDQSKHNRPVFEESQLGVSLPLTVCHNSTKQDSDNCMSDKRVSSEDVHLQDMLEPLPKRLCRNAVTMINESSVCNDRTSMSDRQENLALDSKVCKSEPLDVVEIPDDEVESSLNSENSYLMYLPMYGSGGEGGEGGIPSDTSYSTQYDLSQMNQHSLPGCSSWGSAMRAVNFNSQDKMLNSGIEKPLQGYSKATVSMTQSTIRPTVTVDKLTARPSDEFLHMLYHHGKYICQLCGKRMQRQRDIKAHMASKHFMAKDFCCKLCGAEYGYKYNLQQHMKIKHKMQLNEAGHS